MQASGIRSRGAGVKEGYQSPGKAEQGRHILPGGIAQGMAQKGEVGAVDEPIGVNKEQGFFRHSYKYSRKKPQGEEEAKVGFYIAIDRFTSTRNTPKSRPKADTSASDTSADCPLSLL